MSPPQTCTEPPVGRHAEGRRSNARSVNLRGCPANFEQSIPVKATHHKEAYFLPAQSGGVQSDYQIHCGRQGSTTTEASPLHNWPKSMQTQMWPKNSCKTTSTNGNCLGDTRIATLMWLYINASRWHPHNTDLMERLETKVWSSRSNAPNWSGGGPRPHVDKINPPCVSLKMDLRNSPS